MKSLFFSKSSKFNVLMALCASGVTILNLPVSAAPQDLCVRTSSGDVVCGVPVPKPSSNQNRTDRDETIDTQTNGVVTWELKSCERKERNVVRCAFVLSASQDTSYDVKVMRGTKLVDSSGKEYPGGRVEVGDRVVGGDTWLTFGMTQGARYKTTISFPGVPTSISQMSLLQIQVYYDALIKFRNVPIN